MINGRCHAAGARSSRSALAVLIAYAASEEDGAELKVFLQYYGTMIASTAAIINGFIAVVVAQFFKDHFVAKVLLVVAAAILGAAAIGATVYGQWQIVIARDAEAARRKGIRESLGRFIEEGNAIKVRCADTIASTDADAWAGKVETFLETNLGHSYVIRDRDNNGAFPLTFSEDPIRQNLCYSLYIRIWRLEQFSEQLPG
jgi:hypothetical protein